MTTKAELLKELETIQDDTANLFVATCGNGMGNLVTDKEIIEEYINETGYDNSKNDLDVDTAIRELAEINQDVEYIEIS